MAKTVKTSKSEKSIKKEPNSAKATLGKEKPKKVSEEIADKAKGKEVKVVLTDDKNKIIEDFAQKKGDTGSPEVQVALLTHKITKLSEHLEINKKDNHSRRGLLKVIAKRRRILNYLQKLDEKRYKKLISKLGLKK